MTMLTLFMFVLLTHHSFSASRPECDQTSCNCSRQNLQEVPAAPSQLITELDLSFNRLTTIKEKDFVAYANLQSLIMSNNLIDTIQDQAFVPLTNLCKLDLSINRLDTMSAIWFESLSSLQHLNLLGNPYKTLGQGNLFQALKILKTLHFGGVYLENIGKNDFSGLAALEEITFDGQNLKFYTKGSLSQIRPIQYVTLSLNGPFLENNPLVKAVLSDVVYPSTILTFSNTLFLKENQMAPFTVLRDGGTRRLILKNVTLTMGSCLALMNALSDSNITMVQLEDIKFFLQYSPRIRYSSTMEHLEEIVLKNADVPEFYIFPVLFFLHSLMNRLRKLSVLNCKMFVILCKSSQDFSNLEYLDISDNILNDEALSKMMCNGTDGLLRLRTLNVSRNLLLSMNSHLFTNTEQLENLDMSGNAFHSMPDICYWPPNLKFFNLSSTHLKEATTCLPVSLRVLDVSDNKLIAFNIELPFLTELYISGNRLKRLPDRSLYPRLTFLFIQNNDLQVLSRNNLTDYSDLKVLEAGAKTYICSCEFVAFMMYDLKHVPITFRDELTSYVCGSPRAVRGKSVLHVKLSVFECHMALVLSLLCLGVLAVFLLVAVLCYKYSIVWYMRMIWVWLRAKRKPQLKRKELEYDAFVSYSEMDSGWVEAHLVPELEQAEPHLQLCLHKRDFMPGGWILDNIMDAIEKSHKTLFVLSQHFVRSEWCKYELNYTHFRLFDQNDDTVVLILLEPIDKETIPKKFCKLRRVMNSRTYLEWPDNDNLIPRFWKNLRTALKRPENNVGNRQCENETMF